MLDLSKYLHLTEKDINILQNYIYDDHHSILSELINKFTPNSIGVEIGVYRAACSRYILQNTSTKHLYLVDPWKVYKEQQYHDMLRNQLRADNLYDAVTEMMCEENCSIHRNSIEEIDLPNELGFAFIDGNHSYAGAMKDLECVTCKIKSKGLIVGHDWGSMYPGVVRSVTDYFTKNKDKFLPPFESYDLKHKHRPAPSTNPVVNKSWPIGHLWWTIKR